VETVTGLHMLAERVSAGDRITDEDAQIILESRDLIAVGTMADDVRRRLHGARTTFVRVFEVHVDAPPAALPASLAAGEIRIVGTPSSLEAALAVVSASATLAGSVALTGFSMADLAGLDLPIRDVARRLREAGLQAVSEVPVDVFDDAAAVSTVRDAGLMVSRLTVRGSAGIPSTRIARRAANLQKAAGGFQTYAPLPRIVSPVTPTTGYDDVKLVAMSRLLAADIPSIQVDWPLYGPKLAQVALTMGADDVDGIPGFDPAVLGARRSALAEIVGNIRAAALQPVERNGRFEPIAVLTGENS
jgi:aminodeoxyfutalosine synthase